MRALLLLLSTLLILSTAHTQTCTLTDAIDAGRFVAAYRAAFREQVKNTERNLAGDARNLLENVQEEFIPNTGADCLARSRIRVDYCSVCVRRIGFSVPRQWFARNERRARRRQREFVGALRDMACRRDPCKRHARQSPSPMPSPLTYIAAPQGSFFPLSFAVAVVVELDSARIVYHASSDDPNSLQPSLDGVISEYSGAGLQQNYFDCVSESLQAGAIIDRTAGAIGSACMNNWNIACIEQSLILNLCPSVSGCDAGGISITNIC